VTFDSFSFDQRISAGIAACGFETPTPIQERAIPEVLSGRDVLGLAQTGTGKTAAFALPILQRLLDADAAKRGPARTLILAPTRELAQQIHDNFVELGKQTGIRCAAVFGGVGFGPQIKAFRQATVVVACPGRLLDLLNQGVVELDKVDTLVLDEADRMMDMGFMPDIKRIMGRLPKKRQNLLFSATMPKDIRALADSILNDPATVQVAHSAPVKSVSHAFYPVAQHLKGNLLEALLDETEHESVLIFTRTKHKAKTLARKLDRDGYKATFLQGNMTQNQRQRALDGFRKGTFQVMVATDIAARGIDCERISHVINFDAPDTAETYTHRIGRTGRAGRSGCALSLMTRDDQRLMREIERLVRARIERCTVDGFDYDERDTRPPSNGGHGNGNGRPARNAKAQHKGRPGNRPSRRKGKPRQAAR
jgi:superfamily II DNA/RNA helicase